MGGKPLLAAILRDERFSMGVADPSDLVYFRQRIGEQGVAFILAVSAQLHGARAQEREVVVDSTVQEKNVTYPVDTKQYRKLRWP